LLAGTHTDSARENSLILAGEAECHGGDERGRIYAREMAVVRRWSRTPGATCGDETVRVWWVFFYSATSS
jgi:hypothetical protein